MILLKFFAQCADQVGQPQRRVPFASTPEKILASDPDPALASLRTISHVRVAVNHSWAQWDTPLKDGDEVAIVPPVSGG